MNSIVNSLLEALSMEQLFFAFILIAIVLEAVMAVVIVESYLKIRRWWLQYKLERFDEFEYRNDLY